MREAGVRGLLIYCADYQCSHSIAVMADRWPDDLRLSDIEPRFICSACGKQGRRRAAGVANCGSMLMQARAGIKFAAFCQD